MEANSKKIEFDATHPDYVKAMSFMEGWEDGHRWAHSLKVGDKFLGSMGEAKLRYSADKDYATSAFITSGYRALKSFELYVDNNGIITKIERSA